jgi:hypothetical protein
MSLGGGDLKPPKARSFPLSSLVVPKRTPRSVSSLAPLNPARGECGHDKIDRWKDMKDKLLDKKPQLGEGWIGDGILSSVFLAFSHAFSNVIQSHQVVQIAKQLSFDFPQGQKYTQACPNHLSPQVCTC